MASDARALQELRIDKRAKEPGGLSWVVWLVIFLVIAGLAVGLWVSRRSRPITVTTSLVEEPRVQSAGRHGAERVRLRDRPAAGHRLFEGHRPGRGSARRGGHAGAQGTGAGAPRRRRRRNGPGARRGGTGGHAAGRRRVPGAPGAGAADAQAQRQLRAEGIANQADLDAARDARSARSRRGSRWREEQVRVSERQVAVRQNDVADTVIVAPFDGVAISKDAQPGEMISPVSAGGGFTRTGICTRRGHVVARDRGGRQRELHPPREPAAARGGDARRLPGVADPGQGHHDGADGRPAEGDRAGAHRVRSFDELRVAASCVEASCPTWVVEGRAVPRHPAGHGRQGRVLGAQARPPRRRPRRAIPKAAVRRGRRAARWCSWSTREGRVERRAVRPGAARDDSAWRLSGVAAGERVVVSPSAPLKAGARVVVK